MGMKERMFTGELYYPNEESIFDEQLKKLDLLYEFNSTRPTEQKKRQELMKEMFAEIGENCYLEPPFHANWGGAHMHLGDSVYANFNFTAVDDSHIIHRLLYDDRTQRDRCHSGTSYPARAARKGVSVQYARAYRQKLLDRCGSRDNARSDDRG